MIRVLIKASTRAGRAGLARLLRSYPSLQVIDDNADPRDIIPDKVLHPDVVVLQIESHETEELQRLLEDVVDSIPVIVLGGPSTKLSRMFREGIRGVLPKNASREQVIAAIQAAAAGLIVFEVGEVDDLLEPVVVSETQEALLEPLTDREIEVLRLLADGFGNKEIALRMGISEHTVKFHVASIMGKLGVGNRTEAVMSGILHGLLMV